MFGYCSNVLKVCLIIDCLVVCLVYECDVWCLVDYYVENCYFLKFWELVCDESYCYFLGWQVCLGMIGEFYKQGFVFYFVLFDLEEKEIIGVVNFFNVVCGFFYVCYLGYFIVQKWQG